MGGAVTAVGGDLSAIYWNPAGLAHITGLEAAFTHNAWLAGIDFNYMAFAFQIPGFGILAASVTSLSVPEDDVRTVDEPLGTGERFGASDLAIGLSFARQLTNNFAIGASVKYIRQSIWHSSASTVAGDLGALFTTPFSGIRLGASLTNFGGDMRMDGRDLRFSEDPDPFNTGNVEFINALYETDRFPLPLLFRVGISGELLQTDDMRVTFGMDALHPNDNAESVNTGVEVAFNETIFARAGFASLLRDQSEEGVTLGAGINYRVWGTSTVLKVDYAYSDYGLLSSANRVSVGIRF
jgi:hypothetical protein